MKKAFSGVLCASSAFIFACGGGGGSSNNNNAAGNGNALNTDDMVEVTVEDMNMLVEESAVWRLHTDLELNKTLSTPLGDVTIDADLELAQVLSNQYNGANDIVSDYCNPEGPQQLDIENITFIDEEMMDDVGVSDCGSNTFSYFRGDDSNFVIEHYCDDEKIGQTALTRLSNNPTFDLGELSFTLNQSEEVYVDSGVCGATLFVDMTTTTDWPNATDPESEEHRRSHIIVAVPYEDNRMHLEFDFPGEVKVGTYNVVDESDEAENEVLVDMSSMVFGGTPENPVVQSGVSGTVTIGSVDRFSASGSFDFTTSTGDTMEGRFAFDIE